MDGFSRETRALGPAEGGRRRVGLRCFSAHFLGLDYYYLSLSVIMGSDWDFVGGCNGGVVSLYV